MGSGRIRNILEAAAVLLVGVACSLLLLEGALRVLGAFHTRAAGSDGLSGETDRVRVLCLGDSFTWGAGAPADQSYPRQLQRLLDEARPATYEVVNRGVGGQNSSQLRALAPAVIEEIEPDLLILLTGSANTWNRWGWRPAGPSTTAGTQDLLYRVRLFKLATLVAREVEAQREDRRLARREAVPGTTCGRTALEATSGLAREGRVEEARAALWQVLASCPPSADAFVAMAGLSSLEGDAAASDRWVARATALPPPPPDQLQDLARRLGGAGLTHAGWEILGRARERLGENAGILAAEAILAEAEADLPRAVALAERAAAAAPGRSIYLDLLAEYHLRAGDPAAALVAARRCAEVMPADYHCLVRQAQALMEQGDLEAALDAANRAVALDAAWAGGTRGEVLERMGRLDEARDQYRATARLNPAASFLAANADKVGRPSVPGRAAGDAATEQRLVATLGDLGPWLLDDVTAVIRLGRAAGVTVVVQDYPAHSVSPVLRLAARQEGVRFVAQEAVFAALEDRASYFAPDQHCNSRGYGVMAANLLPAVLEARAPGSDPVPSTTPDTPANLLAPPAEAPR